MINYRKKLLKELKKITYGERSMDLVKAEVRNCHFLLQDILCGFLNSVQVLFQIKN